MPHLKPPFNPSMTSVCSVSLIILNGLFFQACDEESNRSSMMLGGIETTAGESSTLAGNVGGGEQPAGETTAGETTAGETTAGETTAGETTAGETTAGDVVIDETAVCENSIVLNCDTGMIQVHTEQGAPLTNQYSCDDGFTYPGKELLFEFIESEAQNVMIYVRQLEQQFLVNYILFALEGNPTTCNPSLAPCILQQDTLVNDPLQLEYNPSRPLWISLDPRLADHTTMLFEVTVSCSSSACGDGEVNEGEACDDGNLEDQDGCNASCEIENNYRCLGEPSVCILDVNDDCQESFEVSDGVYQGDTRGCQSTYMTISGGCGNQNTLAAPDQSYSITVPANTVIRAHIDTVNESGFRIPKIWLAVDPTQASATCVQSSSETIHWLNGSDTEQTILLNVDGVSETDMGVYQLTIDFLDPPQRPGSSCASPHELSTSGVYQGNTSNDRAPSSNLHGGVGGACVRAGGFWGYNGGADELYRVTLQPGETLTASSTVIGNWDHVLSIHDDCAQLELSCLLWDDYGRGSITNESNAPHDYFIMVGGFYSYSIGEYELEITIE
jgi:cysteine-rich repeat protein